MKKILIIDDERPVCELLRHILEGRNYRTECAHNGLEGLEKVAQFIPDLVLLDVNMPQMDGWQLLKALKSSPATSTIPVIMCTERNLIREIEEAGALGADGYILKPFEVERVVRKVEETLKK